MVHIPDLVRCVVIGRKSKTTQTGLMFIQHPNVVLQEKCPRIASNFYRLGVDKSNASKYTVCKGKEGRGGDILSCIQLVRLKILTADISPTADLMKSQPVQHLDWPGLE